MTSQKIAIVRSGNGNDRVHAADCADVKREVTRFRNGDAYYMTAADRDDVARDWYGDIASDNYEPGTPEWEQEIRDCAASDMSFLPCCKLPVSSTTPKENQIMTTTTHTAESVTLPEGVSDTAPVRATYAALLNGVTGSPAEIAAESGVIVARTRAALNVLKGAGLAQSTESTKVGEAALWSLSADAQETVAEIEAQDLAGEEPQDETASEEPPVATVTLSSDVSDLSEALAGIVQEMAPKLNELATAWDAFLIGDPGTPERSWYETALSNANLTAEEQGFPVRSEQWFECAVATYYTAKDATLDAYNPARQEQVPTATPPTISAKKRTIAAAIMKAAADLTENWDEMVTGVTLAEFQQYGGLWMSYMAKGVWDERLGEFPVRK